MKRVLAILLLVPFIMVLAPPFCRSRLVVSMSCNMSLQVRVGSRK